MEAALCALLCTFFLFLWERTMNTRVIAILVLGFFTAPIPAQELTKKETGPPVSPHIIQLTDGSRLVATILQKEIRFVTKYGELAVPFADVRKIEFGFHCPPEMEDKIRAHIECLKSNDFRQRDNAQKNLAGIGHLAYPFVKKVSASKNDLESAKRAAAIMERIQLETPPNLLSFKDCDTLQTKELTITGKLQGSMLKAWSPHVGEISINFHSICSVNRGVETRNATITVDSTHYGSSPDQWLNTKILVNPNTRLIVAVSGQIDLWPQGPGQYMTGPKGYNTAGKGSVFMAGAVVGRIGEKGKSFLIGENYNEIVAEEGELFLQIVPSPWNNASLGNFQARVMTSCAVR